MPSLIHILLLFLLTKESKASCQDTWPSCRGTKNTVCERDEKCGPVDNCEEVDVSGIRKAMIEIHNELRNKIALGQDTRGGNSQASNMRAISYDVDLEYGAQCHVNRCKFDHDKCRATKTFSYAGQNLYTKSVKITTPKQAKDGVVAWYGEIENVTGSIIETFGQSDFMIGHFTQLVWAKTSHVGCAVGHGYRDKWSILACNYGVGGNLLGTPVYKRGTPCSECGDLKCNSEYTGLCGEATGGVGLVKLKSVLLILLIVILIFNRL